jgi:phage-related protein
MAYPLFSPPGSINISPGSSVDVTPRVRKAPFGDGYAQRSGDGINAMVRTFNAQFAVISATEAQSLLDFFRERAGYKPFRWTLPGEASPRQWIAPSWRKTYSESGVSDVTVSLEENFDP